MSKTVKLPFGLNLSWGAPDKEIEKEAVKQQILEDVREMRKEPIPVNIPIKAGRSSVPDGQTLMDSLVEELGTVTPNFDLRFLEVLENLAMYNPDVSYAIDNVVQLGNTPYTVEFDEAVPEDQAEEMVRHLNTRKAKWYSHSGGTNSLINDLFAQIALTGALSAEVVPNNFLDGVKKAVLVNPLNIQFLYDKDKDEYKAYQKAAINGAGSLALRGLKELNPVTYKYYAIRRFNERPYAIPPFLSALEHIALEKDMMCNLKSFIKKLGLFGFLEVLLTPPDKRSPHAGAGGETDAQYEARLRQYLQASASELEKALSTGKVIGFKGSHEFNLEGVAQNGAQVKEVFELVAEMKMAGLKQDPLMLGRNFSTTETVGRVILTKLSTQIANYQALVAAFLNEMFLMELQLAGFKVTEVITTFEKPMITDEKKEQEAYKIKIENYRALYQDGIIDQVGRAQALGFDEPAEDEPLPPPPMAINPNMPPPEDNKRTDPGNTTKESNRITALGIMALESALGGSAPEFDYQLEHKCGDHCNHGDLSYELAADDADDAAKAYAAEMQAKYHAAVKRITKKVTAELGALGKDATEAQVRDRVVYHLFKEFKTKFSDQQKGIISKWVSKSYRAFRSSTDGFGGMVASKIPKPVFGLVDTRTLEYFKNSDGLYLGKFITDEDTKKKVFKFIKEKYVAGEIPLGRDAKGLELFRAEFGDLLRGEDYKIFRIINTTVNTMKSYATVNYLEQAGIQEYEIRGINDRLQCGYCAEMQGKRFSVSAAQGIVKEVTNSDPEFVKAAKPFITSVYKKPEDMANVSSEELMRQGVSLPAFHPGCRDRTIAVF